MVTALPRNIRLRLEQTLSQWRYWRCDPELMAAPEAVAVLGQGISNFSVLVGAKERYVVRIDGINPASNGLNRQTEWRAIQAASAAGLAPTPRYFNPDLGSLVCDYLEPDAEQEVSTRQVATLLRNIHRLPARHNRLDLAERILRYEKQLAHTGRGLPAPLQQLQQNIPPLLQRIRSRSSATVLCHNDLLKANRIYSGGVLRALDWEYCAMGSPWYDLAVIIVADALPAAQTETLLRHYLGRQANAAQQDELNEHCCVYRYLELLWYLCLDRQVLSQSQLQQKTAALAQALASQGS